ncbi:ABC transporter permease subunit [Zavarzinia compransoris]|uniref:Peptide ABC transporter permease n=1 Tax=Zavarzinia compransoris TaxID=1264899 RepID=A0A317E669_9PROT|nr:ABC transporter permease subunit [Zavarzinia compransoris]PWR22112.1 peptide ABC transporter permease [Zavarzinia compransoris]TDP47142.1 dipeptide transport system permease protein [Zavarzinia compransoris]
MLRFLSSRLLVLIPTLLGVVLLAFFLVRQLHGDAVEARSGERGITTEQLAERRKALGLDRPLHEQFLAYLGQVVQGDLGKSYVTQRPVLDEFLELFPATIELSIVAMAIAIVIGLPAGILAALTRGSIFDHGVMGAALTGYSMPIFWWAVLLIVLFSNILGLTPVSGRLDVLYYIEPTTGFMLIDTLLSEEPGAFWSALHHLILPSVVLGTIPLAVIARMTRSAMLEVLGEDYIRTARAKGLSPSRVIWVHALRNALIPVVTVIGLQTGTLLAGAVLTETIFSWPGIGKWLIDAIGRRDFPAVQGGILLIAVTIITVNLAVDLLYGLINPRIRYQK